jgi:hypothetical protein
MPLALRLSEGLGVSRGARPVFASVRSTLAVFGFEPCASMARVCGHGVEQKRHCGRSGIECVGTVPSDPFASCPFRKSIIFFTAEIGMAIRTFVRYFRVLWSSLGIGVPNDKIMTGPSPAEPCIPAQKNCGAFSPTDMSNPWLLAKPQECGAENPWLAQQRGRSQAHGSAPECLETPNVF